MVGALVAKAAAFSVPNDPVKERHLTDFAVIAAMARPSDRIAQQLTARDRDYLAAMLEGVQKSRPLWAGIEGAGRGILALAALTTGPPQRNDSSELSPSVSLEPPTVDL